jgi:excinuclease UvrABC nuclease subunit
LKYDFAMRRSHDIVQAAAYDKLLASWEKFLFDESGRVTFQASRQWAVPFPAGAGVYAVFELDTLVYVGESGSLRGRMIDLLETRNHTLRRSIGNAKFRKLQGFVAATSKQKFPEHIEALLTAHMERSLKVKAVEIQFGRLELEEHLIAQHRPQFNRKTKRA